MPPESSPGAVVRPINDHNPWHGGNRFELTVSDPTATCTWRIELGRNDDARIRLRERSPAGERAGEIILVAGHAMLWKDLNLEPGCESDTIDGAGLMLQLALHLLWRAVPLGAGAVTGEIAIDVNEEGQDLVVGTLGAGGAFPAPWSVQGTASPAGGGVVRFELSFAFGAGDTAGAVDLSGTWEQCAPPPELDEQMPIAGWSLARLGARLEEGRLDYGSTAQTSDAATLGELRRQLA